VAGFTTDWINARMPNQDMNLLRNGKKMNNTL